eukprot:CAMPEP_0113304816 /NCGR_PEP_ID=MMETSP0010_2-20120614/4673_1 /TAXON_ID=216773 ORGANISM="Corethron hystrix, Strain 308" /NCGR_SAMPLE_ID=MMETSP0010_2 /ASSEMBLY_ACC=CAM_ASM_000155 /LENGTH=221 /DNA_ID=CAMNT_0000159073 /DNA_START=1518 /DNA_END=2183 /DNA_ORIENTATION=- /assembly_acc=CAM_ASM_000155
MVLCIRSQTKSDGIKEKETETEGFEAKIHSASVFTIDTDGSIYPTLAPHLCLGFAPIPALYIVARDSPNQAVFKYFSELKNSKHSSSGLGADELLKECGNNLVKLELSSHPGMAISQMYPNMASPLIPGVQMGGLGLGPAENALAGRINEKNQMVVSSLFSEVTITHGLAQNLDIGKMIFVSTHFEPWFCEFVVNDNGTISPKSSDQFVFGFQIPGIYNSK